MFNIFSINLMAKTSEYLTVVYLDDLDTTGRTRVMFNIRPDSFNQKPKFKGVSAPANPRSQQRSTKLILEAAQKQTTTPLEIGYEDEGLVQRVTYLYDPSKWSNKKEERPGFESFGTFWEMKPLTDNIEAMESQVIKIDVENYHVTLGDLRRALNKLPVGENYDKLRVWLGSDSGEGYEPLVAIAVENARFVSLDGDASNSEAFYLDPEEPGKTEKDIPEEYSEKDVHEDGSGIAWKHIVVLCGPQTLDDISYLKKSHQKAQEKIKKKEAARLAQLELEKDPEYIRMKELELSLKNKGKL